MEGCVCQGLLFVRVWDEFALGHSPQMPSSPFVFPRLCQDLHLFWKGLHCAEVALAWWLSWCNYLIKVCSLSLRLSMDQNNHTTWIMQSKIQPQGRTNWQDFCLFVLVTVVNFGQMNFTAIKHHTAAAAFIISCSSLSSWTLLIRTEAMSQRMYILGGDSYLSLSLCSVNDVFLFSLF